MKRGFIAPFTFSFINSLLLLKPSSPSPFSQKQEKGSEFSQAKGLSSNNILIYKNSKELIRYEYVCLDK